MNRAPVPPPARPVWERIFGFIGIAAHLVVGFFYLTAGLVTPAPWLVGLILVWVALLVVAILLLRRRPLLVLVVPVVALGLLIGGISLGKALLGWTA